MARKTAKAPTVDVAARRAVTKVMIAATEAGFANRRTDPERVYFLRYSSFPFCGVQWFHKLPTSTAPLSRQDFSSLFFTSVGTTVHTALQTAVGSVASSVQDNLSIRVLNDWSCRNCKCRHPMQVKPRRCTNCGKTQFIREEVELRDDVKLGHVDEILEFSFAGGVHLVPIDYKTCTLVATTTPGKLPYQGNKFQLSGYVQTLRDLGHSVPIGCLIYVPRDNPFRFVVHQVTVGESESRWLKFYEEQFLLASSVSGPKGLRKLVDSRPCANGAVKRYSECSRIGSCAGAANTETVFFELDAVRGSVQDHLPIRKQV